MLVFYADNKYEKIPCYWNRYIIEDHNRAAIFEKGVKVVQEKSQQRMEEMRKVACRGGQEGKVVVNM